MAILKGIALREASRASMKVLDQAEVPENEGIIGDFEGRGGSGRGRQITSVTNEA